MEGVQYCIEQHDSGGETPPPLYNLSRTFFLINISKSIGRGEPGEVFRRWIVFSEGGAYAD